MEAEDESHSLVKWNGDLHVEKGLCTKCRDLNLQADLFFARPLALSGTRHSPPTFPLTSSTSPTKLGTLREISERSYKGCNLCNLIIRSTQGSIAGASLGLDDLSTLRHVACYLSWEVDGRRITKPDSTDRNKSSQDNAARTLTRRIHLRWEDQLLEDCYLVLLAPERYFTTASDGRLVWGSESSFLGRKIEGRGNIQARIKSWLDLCQDSHGGLCNSRSHAQLKFEKLLKHSYFGVIDVVNMQLTELPFTSDEELPRRSQLRPVPYAVLSYVWGQTQTFTTKLDNVYTLRMHGGVEKILPELPKAIQNSIDLVRRLGLQYLWIDALCIIQDSPRSWKLNAYNMDSIYGNAALTICAADGKDASAGLKAMSSTNEIKRQEVAMYAEGVRLMVTRPPEMFIKESVWNSRAWTFQERLLSRRCLIFVEGRIYFQCRSTGMSEDIYSDREGTGWSLDFVDAPMQVFWQVSERAFWVYMRVAELYSSRELSKTKDILVAFSGITNLLQRTMRAPFVFGLPTSHFDLALLWQHVAAVERRKPKNEAEKEEYGDLEFPSWSWIGWMGAATTYSSDILGDCLDNASEWLERHTWVRWYVRDGHGDLTPLWSAPDPYSERYTNEYRYVHRTTLSRDSSSWLVDRSKDARWRGYGDRRTSGKLIMTHHSKRAWNNDSPWADSESSRASDESKSSDDSPTESEWKPRPDRSPKDDLEREEILIRHRSDDEDPDRSRTRLRRRRSRRDIEIERRPSNDRSLDEPLPPPPSSMDHLLGMPGRRCLICDLLVVFSLLMSLVDWLLGRLRLHWLCQHLRGVRLLRHSHDFGPLPPPFPSLDTFGREDSRKREGYVLERERVQSWRPEGVRASSRERQQRAEELLEADRRLRAREMRQTFIPLRSKTPGPELLAPIRPRSGPMRRTSHYVPRVSVMDMSQRRQDAGDPHYSRIFRPLQDVSPADTDTNPKFFIYPKECPYRVVVAPFKRKLDAGGFSCMPILQFWTWHTYLYIQLPSEPVVAGNGLMRCHIADANGDWCGSIVLDESWVRRAPSARQEFVAISEAKKFSRDECENWTYYIQKERDQSEWDLFFVLLIERKKEKCERVGLGKVFKEAFRDSKWAEIMLN